MLSTLGAGWRSFYKPDGPSEKCGAKGLHYITPVSGQFPGNSRAKRRIIEISKGWSTHITRLRALPSTAVKSLTAWPSTRWLPIALESQVTYDVMDVDAKQFDEDFYGFRVVIKELERRLAAIIIQVRMNTVQGRVLYAFPSALVQERGNCRLRAIYI